MNLFKWLFGKKEKPVELPPEFVQANPPDWLIDLKGPGLASGNTLSVRVQLFETNRAGTVDVMALPGAGGEPQSATAQLDRTEIDRLLVILGFSFPADFASVGDGMDKATTVSVYRHEPFVVRETSCELVSWLDSKKPGPPVVEVGRILVEIQRRVFPAS